ncbi:MAG: hypothetical protein WA945_10275 [Arcobacteraceae bacterium]
MGFEDNYEDEEEMEFGENNMGSLDEELGNEITSSPTPSKGVERQKSGTDNSIKYKKEIERLEEQLEKQKEEKAELQEKISLYSEKNIDEQKTSQKAVKKLHQDLEEMEYALSNFNRFNDRIKTFKVWNTIVWGFSGLIIGIIIAFYAMSELYSYKEENMSKKFGKDYEIGNAIRTNGFIISNQDNQTQVYIKRAGNVSIFETDEYYVIQKNK